jgi:hypothetical protein
MAFGKFNGAPAGKSGGGFKKKKKKWTGKPKFGGKSGNGGSFNGGGEGGFNKGDRYPQ